MDQEAFEHSEGGRIPPHDSRAESSVLGALLLDSDRIADVAEGLHPEDFFEKRHQLIYACLLYTSDAADE